MSATTRPRLTFVRRITLPMLPRVWSPNRWTPRRGLGSLRDSSTGSRIFVSPWRTRWEKVTWSPSVHFKGTHHTGEFQGLPPTQSKVSFFGLELNRFVEGRVAEHWFQLDALTLLRQLGLVVVPGPRLLPRIVAHQLKKLRKTA